MISVSDELPPLGECVVLVECYATERRAYLGGREVTEDGDDWLWEKQWDAPHYSLARRMWLLDGVRNSELAPTHWSRLPDPREAPGWER